MKVSFTQFAFIGMITCLFSFADPHAGRKSNQVKPRPAAPAKKICHHGVCEGDWVIDGNNYVGLAAQVFQNGLVKVKYPGYSGLYNRVAEHLSVQIQKDSSGFSQNQFVMDQNGEVGIIHSLFENGKAKILFLGYSSLYDRKTSNLAQRVETYKQFSEGDFAVDKAGNVGKIDMLFDNGKFRLIPIDANIFGKKNAYIRNHRELSIR